MKKLSIVFVLILIAVSVFSGCSMFSGQNDTDGKDYRVTFNLNYPQYIDPPEAQTIEEGGLVNKPTNPTRDGYTFDGWYTEDNVEWNFETDRVYARLTLYAKWNENSEFTYPIDKDLSGMTDGVLENAIDYKMFYVPDKTAFVGDLMPYYENGVFSMFYLKDGGDSVRHSVFRADTTDFFGYENKGRVINSASAANAQDYWIGTGSIAKAGNDYYFFYTGHNGNKTPKEKVMVAKSSGNMDSFIKVTNFSISADSSLNQNDFRDPQAFYDPVAQKFDLIITTNKNGIARIVKYSVSLDLKTISYDGIVFTDTSGFMNLECADIFKIGSKYYLSYSGQDDTLWYAVSDSKFSGYGTPKRLDGKYFYAPKSVSDGTSVFFVGWIRRHDPQTNSANAAWAGNLAVQKVKQNSDGSLVLIPIDNLDTYFTNRRELLIDTSDVQLNESGYQNFELSPEYESYMVKGKFSFSDDGDFGLAFGYGGDSSDFKHIKISPTRKRLWFTLQDGQRNVTEVKLSLDKNREYSFTLLMEGSCGIFYVDGIAALTLRFYNSGNKTMGFFADNNNPRWTNLAIYTRKV